MDLISREAEIEERKGKSAQNVSKEDLISRKAAINAVNGVIADYIPTLYGRYEALPLEMAMAIKRLPTAQPEKRTAERTETHACDCISRQAAIDFIAAGHLVNPNEPRWSDNEVVNFLKSRPSAQRTGRWIEDSGNIACSECHIIWLHRRTAFCPNCGADMRGE